MKWYLEVLRKYAVFGGRARRKEYWFFMLFNLLITIVLCIVDLVTGTLNAKSGLGLISGLYSLAVLIPSLAVSVRRLHDINKSGWWIFIAIVPIIGQIIFFIFTLMDSKPEENAWGPSPKLSA